MGKNINEVVLNYTASYEKHIPRVLKVLDQLFIELEKQAVIVSDSSSAEI